MLVSRLETADLGTPYLSVSYKQSVANFVKRLRHLATLVHNRFQANTCNVSSFHYLVLRTREDLRYTLKQLRHSPQISMQLVAATGQLQVIAASS